MRTLTFLVRTHQLDTVVAAARREVAQLDPEQPLYDVKTMERAFFEILAGDRVITGMFGSSPASPWAWPPWDPTV